MTVMLALLAGCSGDGDGDGLRNEDRWGSDPEQYDTDGDGIDDGAEVRWGLDPTDVDSDGDGYDDLEELIAGTDPGDADSVIYAGGWPYQPFKDTLFEPGSYDDPAQQGSMFPRFVGLDQFGEEVDFYDFADTDGEILVSLCVAWKIDCQYPASWLAQQGGPFDTLGPGPYTYEDGFREAVADGRVRWVTVLTDGFEEGVAATLADVQAWHAMYPHPQIPVLLDADGALMDWASQHREDWDRRGSPIYIRVRNDMVVRQVDEDSVIPWMTFTAMLNEY